MWILEDNSDYEQSKKLLAKEGGKIVQNKVIAVTLQDFVFKFTEMPSLTLNILFAVIESRGESSNYIFSYAHIMA